MASLWKHPESKYWVACYTDGQGKQRKKSTKIAATEKNRAAALRIADEMEKAHRRRLTTSQIFNLCGNLVKEITGEEMEAVAVGSFLDAYLKRRKSEVSTATLAAYTTAATKFKAWLGEKVEMEIFRIEKKHIQAYRDHLAAVSHPATANHAMKCLRIFFKEAMRERLTFENPCDDVALLLTEKASARRGFTLKELGKIMVEAEGSEWVSLVRFGLYTGQRLGDLAALQWGQVNLLADEIQFTTRKTGRRVLVPICGPLKDHLASLDVDDDPAAFVHPRAAGLGVSHLSREFGEMLARCGLRAEVPKHHAKKEGRDGARRELNALSFHSLRHSAVSMMKNAGISPAIVQDLVGHESAEMSAHYTHIESEAKRKAVDSLPVI
ncbi:MAG: site-specific integrase [Verrucomicrobiaceae bacterium]|nr:site-specific integrase [Verrucomicrobiaceae bacterium]